MWDQKAIRLPPAETNQSLEKWRLYQNGLNHSDGVARPTDWVSLDSSRLLHECANLREQTRIFGAAQYIGMASPAIARQPAATKIGRDRTAPSKSAMSANWD
jgi:hypothetical protein